MVSYIVTLLRHSFRLDEACPQAYCDKRAGGTTFLVRVFL